jgi:hypothetical protein
MLLSTNTGHEMVQIGEGARPRAPREVTATHGRICVRNRNLSVGFGHKGSRGRDPSRAMGLHSI